MHHVSSSALCCVLYKSIKYAMYGIFHFYSSALSTLASPLVIWQISMSSSTLLNLPYTSWAVDSDPHLIILAINAMYIPEPVGSDKSLLVRVDGLWGPHEW